MLFRSIVLIVIKLISIIPNKFNFVESWPTTYWKIQDFFKIYSKKAIIFTWLTKFVVGTKVNDNLSLINLDSLYIFGSILLTLIVVLTLSILLIKPLFFKMASYPFEYRKNEKAKIKENIQYPSFFAFLKKEFLLIIRTPNKFNTLVIMAIVTPLSIFLMNKIYLAMDVRDVGKWMIMAFNILMISLMVQSTNSFLATSFSEEGPAFYLSKINPNKYSKSLVAKLIFNMFLMTISILISVIIFANFRRITFGNALLIFLVIEVLYIAHAFWSAELDIMNPYYNQYSTVGSMITNPNEVKSTILGFVLSIILALFTYINLSENQLNQTKVWIKLLIIVSLFLTYRIYMYFTQIKLYFKEK